MRCLTEDEYVNKMHFYMGLYLRNKWGLWANSELANFFLKQGIFHPDDMSSIILKCFHQKVKTNKFDFYKTVNFYKEYWEKIKNEENEKIKRDSIKREKDKIHYLITQKYIDSLHKAINYERILKHARGLIHDSINFYIVQKNYDTINYWTSGNFRIVTKEEYVKETKLPQFGKTLFFGQIDEEGNICDQDLELTRFIKRNDTLFYENNEVKNYFFNIFTPQMKKNIHFILKWKQNNNCSFNKSFIKILWVLNKKKYYLLELQGDCRGTELQVRYFIDEDLNVIFDGNIIKKLWDTKPKFTKE